MQIRKISDTLFINNAVIQGKPHVISAALGQEVASKISLESKKKSWDDGMHGPDHLLPVHPTSECDQLTYLMNMTP